MTANENPSPDTIKSANEMTHTDPDQETKAEILADLRQALQEAIAGDLRPALEVLDEIDNEITDHADRCSRTANLPVENAVPQKEVSPSNH